MLGLLEPWLVAQRVLHAGIIQLRLVDDEPGCLPSDQTCCASRAAPGVCHHIVGFWRPAVGIAAIGQFRHEHRLGIALGRIEEPGDVADIVLFLASDLSRFLTGEAVNASGGVTMD